MQATLFMKLSGRGETDLIERIFSVLFSKKMYNIVLLYSRRGKIIFPGSFHREVNEKHTGYY
jgi:hypothetical protein